MKHLPIGIQTFETLVTQNFTYVDKTGLLAPLVTIGGRYFLSRPRRFGKSLTCSTLDAIFSGRKKLFNDLAISKTDYTWPVRPMVRFDFSGIDHSTPDELKQALSNTLDTIARKNSLTLEASLLKEKFSELIIKLAAQSGPVVVIIDEYDKAILDHLHNPTTAQSMREILRNFYGTLKDKDIDSNLHLLFITGVSKFSKISLFSELNNLNDLTLDERAATLCGYTQTELELVFDKHIDELTDAFKKTKKETLTELKTWYNGYQFSKRSTKVYNPFSILNCLSKKDISSYWFTSGTPQFLMNLIQKNPAAIKKLAELDEVQIGDVGLENFSIETYFQNFVVLFLQTGYLTITRYDNNTRNYILSYPNSEVRSALTGQILTLIANIPDNEFNTFIYRFTKTLKENNIESFCAHMRDFFVLIPHNIVVEREKFFQGIFFSVAKLIGARILTEYATNRGFIDAVIETDDHIFVIEFKHDRTPALAMKQIEEKDYCKKFTIEGAKPVTLIGMNFDLTETGVVVDWVIKRPA